MLFSFEGNRGNGFIFTNIGLISPIKEGYMIKHKEPFKLSKNINGHFEANFVFKVKNKGNFAIGINNHSFMDDYDILLMDHRENEFLISSQDFDDTYIHLNHPLKANLPYRVTIVGSTHESNREGEFYIKQMKNSDT